MFLVGQVVGGILRWLHRCSGVCVVKVFGVDFCNVVCLVQDHQTSSFVGFFDDNVFVVEKRVVGGHYVFILSIVLGSMVDFGVVE